MDKYQRVEKPRQQEQPINENEIRITTQGKMRNYISYATTLFQSPDKKHEVVLKAMGRAINKTVTIAEILKRRISGLHQISRIDSTDIIDVWEPLEEGLDRVETTRHVSSITIILSQTPLDVNDPGYQAPLSPDQIKPIQENFEDEEGSGSRGRGRGRGGRGGFRGGRGRGFRGGRGSRGGFRGRGFRGGRGRGRGGNFRTNDNFIAEEDQVEHQQQQQGNQEEGAFPPRRGGRGGSFRGPSRGRARGRGGFRGRGGRSRGRGAPRGGVPPRFQPQQ